MRERKGVRLREPKVRETLELFEDALARGGVNPPLLHTGHQVSFEGFHALRTTLGSHCTAKLIGPSARKTCCIRRDAHELLLEERHAERLTQSRFEEWVQVSDLLTSRSPPQVGVDRAPLDRAGAYEGNLHDDVVEAPRFETGKRVHLRARLHLKDANRVGCAQQVVDPRILLRKSVQSQGFIAAPMHHSRRPAAQELIRCLSGTCVASLERVEGDAQRRQHAERE